MVYQTSCEVGGLSADRPVPIKESPVTHQITPYSPLPCPPPPCQLAAIEVVAVRCDHASYQTTPLRTSSNHHNSYHNKSARECGDKFATSAAAVSSALAAAVSSTTLIPFSSAPSIPQPPPHSPPRQGHSIRRNSQHKDLVV